MLIAGRSVTVGWVALFALTIFVERPLLRWIAPILGANWVPTEQQILACAGLFTAGWIVGRWCRLGVFAFAITIAIWNFGLAPQIDLPWLGRLLVDCFENSRYLESFFTSLATHALMFGSLFAGAALSRPRKQVGLNIR